MQKITPSKHDPWIGGMENALTQPQQAAMRRVPQEQIDWRIKAKLPPQYTVRRFDDTRTHQNGMPMEILILCPVLAATKDRTRILVIAPDGSRQWVNFR